MIMDYIIRRSANKAPDEDFGFRIFHDKMRKIVYNHTYRRKIRC